MVSFLSVGQFPIVIEKSHFSTHISLVLFLNNNFQ